MACINPIKSHGQFFAHTSPHRDQGKQDSASVTVKLDCPTADTGLLVSAAWMDPRAIYCGGCRYEKAGVMLIDCSRIRCDRMSLIFPTTKPQHTVSRDRTKFMVTLDKLKVKARYRVAPEASHQGPAVDHAAR